MAHEIAKLLLYQAETFLERTEAIETALSLGMPLHEIETYLDWLDQLQNGHNVPELPEFPPSQNIEGAEST
jgi:DNA-binding transcriptional MerR regulator